jgi:hypothetical protein
MDLKSKSDSQLRNMLNKDSGYSANEVRSVLAEMKSRGLPTPPAKMVTGGRKAKDVDVTLPTPKPKKKTAMMRGGMANGKQHMYAAGGMVNDGLKALKASGPKGLEAYNKITGK